ncbi:gamma-glutamyl-gamma-aminobutyrate hydrolase family protein [Thalassotalea nanhaiensis]|uniref:Gamma-glutamyl-gamma-aminobutyrate hydrolase family protein n=1 Tax=Thalassotalea nanhaiensis TaxID=3065648 RepID=A0ABY9TJD0_9GAMM|nr:gamma-glutamyl-gamma-aminobutyrate hydrolase family protein [Colwelliaceae bacterium SQ345]
MTSKSIPIVGVICDRDIIGPHPFHIAGDKYLQAILGGSKCQPVLIPALANDLQIEQLIELVDGVLLTGGYSMVNPLHYQDEPAHPDTKLDVERDNSSLLLIKAAIEKGVPLLGICRGFQEMNVAFGGSLHQNLHHVGQFIEHREDKDLPLEQQYSESHTIKITEHGLLHTILNEKSIDVNSLHTQGVNELGDGLTVEAVAEDGLVEAFSVNSANSFAMAVQWHPEWQYKNNQHSIKIFTEFGKACANRQKVKQHNG